MKIVILDYVELLDNSIICTSYSQKEIKKKLNSKSKFSLVKKIKFINV